MPIFLNSRAAARALQQSARLPAHAVGRASLPLVASWPSRRRLRFCLTLLLCLSGTPAALADCPPQAVTPHCGAAPQPAQGPDGQLWVAFVAGEHVYLARSADAGASFTAAVAVNAEPEAIYADGENRPALAFGAQGEVFVAWTRRNAEAYSGDIRFARSLDGGRSFEAARTVNDDGLLTSHRFVAMVSGADGAPTLAWLDKRDQVAALAAGQPYVGAALYYTRSDDAGASFLPNRKVADQSCECCRVALAPGAGDEVQVLWRHVFEDGRVRDHATARLGREAASAPQRASFDQWFLEGCPHHGPALAAAAGGYQLAWFSNGEAARGVLTGFHEAASGRTLHVQVLDSGAGAGHPQVAVQDGVTHVVWKAFDGSAMTVRLAQSLDGGRHWSEPRSIASTAAASDHPLLLKLNGRVHLSWHSPAEGYRVLPLPAPPLQPFLADSLPRIESAQAQPFLLVLWSVDCPPCFAELKMLSALRRERGDLPLVLLSADPPQARQEALEVLEDYGLLDVESWQFGEDFPERLRHAVDPGWYGELPRSYFYLPDRSRSAHSGLLRRAQVEAWLQEVD